MMIKFLARGTGSAAAAADYLTREQNLSPEQDQDQDQDRDPEKNPEEVKVLRGNPHQVAGVADALQFEHKYTSGVIAWAPEDNPSDAQIGRVVDEFEKTAWAGLEPDRYTWAAVQHREAGGGVHVHVLAARCDLETGKSLNIAAPGWQKTFDALRDWQNHENGWSRPDDPERARDVQPGHRAYIEAAQLRAGVGGGERSPEADYRLFEPGHRNRGRLGSRHDGFRLTAGGPGGAAPGGALPHGGGPRERRQVAVERSDL